MAENVNEKKNILKDLKKFFSNIIGEVKKIVWPNREQVTNNTLVVLGCVGGIGVVIWAIDYVLRFLVSLII